MYIYKQYIQYTLYNKIIHKYYNNNTFNTFIYKISYDILYVYM